MSEFQQGMILRNVCNDTHCIYIQDIPDVGYGKNCIVYNLRLNRYIGYGYVYRKFSIQVVMRLNHVCYEFL